MMSDAVIIAMVGAGAAVLAAMTAAVGLIVSTRNQKKLSKVEERVLNLSVTVDGRMTQILELTSALQRAAGIAEGRREGAAERQDRVIESERVEDRAAGILASAAPKLAAQIEHIDEVTTETHEAVKEIQGKPKP